MKTKNYFIRLKILSGLVAFAFALSNPLRAETDDHDHAMEEKDAHDQKETEPHVDEHEDELHLSAADFEDFGIELSNAGPGEIHTELRLMGNVSMNENEMTHVSPRFDAVVTRIHKRLGDEVKKGDLLAELESNETLNRFELTAPLDGTVVDTHITLGESLSSGEMSYVIADTSTIWIDLKVYQRDLPKMKLGLPVHIDAGETYPQVTGKLSYVGPTVDGSTRTGLVRAEVPNPEGLYRPELFVTGTVVMDTHRYPVVVPLSAMIRMGEDQVVFVAAEDEEGAFEMRVVKTGRVDHHSAEIQEGLQAGERYVSQGGFFLKADAQKANFGDGHGH